MSGKTSGKPNEKPKEKVDMIVTKDPGQINLVDPDKVIELVENRRKILSKILEPDDVQVIEGKDFKKKRYWRKLGNIYGVSLEKLEEREERDDSGNMVYHYIYRAILTNGLHADGSGSCAQNEKRGRINSIHNTRATAETRAKNRAIADLLAFGEVTAEEVDLDREAGQVEERAATATVVKEPTPEELNDNRNKLMFKQIKDWMKEGYIYLEDDIMKAIRSHDKDDWGKLNDGEKFSVYTYLADIVRVRKEAKEETHE